MPSNRPPTTLGARYHNVDHMKILYHFSSVHYKSMLCPFWETSQRSGIFGCEFCLSDVYAHGVPGHDEGYAGRRSLRTLSTTKCIFLHIDDIEKEYKLPTGYFSAEWRKYQWKFNANHNLLQYAHQQIGEIRVEVPLEKFDPTTF